MKKRKKKEKTNRRKETAEKEEKKAIEAKRKGIGDKNHVTPLSKEPK